MSFQEYDVLSDEDTATRRSTTVDGVKIRFCGKASEDVVVTGTIDPPLSQGGGGPNCSKKYCNTLL